MLFFTVETSFFNICRIREVIIREVIIRDFKDGLVTRRRWSPRTDQIASCLPEIVCRFSGEDGVN